MSLRQKEALLTALLMIIFISSNTYTSELQLKDAKYFRLTEHYKVYEFNIGYVKVSQYNVYDVVTLPANLQIINKTMFLETIGGPSQYDTSDFYDLNYSSNVTLSNMTFISDIWRGTMYYNPSMKFEFNDINEDAKTTSFWVTYKLKRFPHLHTHKELIPNEVFHLGINSDPQRDLKKYINILAFPAGTELTEIFHHMPSRQESDNNWIYLIYDLTEIKGNVGYHVKFILFDNNISELNMIDLIQIMMSKNE